MRWLPASTGLLGLLLAVAPAAAQSLPGLRLFANPPDLRSMPPPAPAAALLARPRTQNGNERFYDLAIRYVDGFLYDPANQRPQRVKLRSYVDTTATRSDSAPFVAPAWPPETGASTNPMPRPADSLCIARAHSADAVV